MHFSSAAALVALSSLGVTYAAPFANPQKEIVRRKLNYQVVNVDGESTSSAAPEIETVTETETIKSVTTAPGSAPLPVTVTVTATPSSTPIPSPTSHSHAVPPPGASFFPPTIGSGFLRRGLMAAGDPLQFARSYDSSTVSVTETPLAARGWYSSLAATPTSSAVITPSLNARQFGDSVSFSVATPSLSVSPCSLAAREFGGWNPSVSLSATPSSTALASPTPIVVRDLHISSSSSAAAAYTPLAARKFHGQYYPSASSWATPSSSFTLSPPANALLY